MMLLMVTICFVGTFFKVFRMLDRLDDLSKESIIQRELIRIHAERERKELKRQIDELRNDIHIGEWSS